MVGLHELLTIGFKELGKLAVFAVYKIAIEGATAVPEKIFVENDTAGYQSKLVCWFLEKEEELLRLENENAPQEVVDSFRKQIIRLAFYEYHLYAVVSDMFWEDGKQIFCVIHMERSINDKSYKLRNIENTTVEFLPPRDVYDSNNVTFREFVVVRMLDDYMANVKIYEHLSKRLVADRLKHMLRDAAREYVRLIQYHELNRKAANEGEYSMYDNFDMISALNYEGVEINGSILLCDFENTHFKQMTVRFAEPIEINAYKKMRKLLEISTNQLLLVSDGSFAYGFVAEEFIPETQSDIFIISYQKRNIWKISCLNQGYHTEIMDVEYSYPKLQKSKIDLNEVLIAFHNVFKSEQEEMENIFDVINVAVEQKRGTMLVFSEAAESEAIRLKGASIPIEYDKLDLKAVKRITEIDGAILFDKYCTCYAIGVILDGMSGLSDKEDISRGARYNAAAKYLSSNPTINCVIVIISEDGNIDIMLRR